MSIQRRGSHYVVRWREGGRQLARTFARRGDAAAFELDVKRRRQLGALAPGVIQSRMTLAEFVREDWWPRHVIATLKPPTQRRYLEVWGVHLLPYLGDYELRAITPTLIEDLRAEYDRQGVGVPSQRKALMVLQGILRRAVVHGLIPGNPVAVVDKPRQPPTRRPEPLSPLTIERIRTQVQPRDAVLISLMAYAGLRPVEALRARWANLGERTLHVHASKTERPRMIKLLAPLAQDLNEWRLACGRPPDDALICPTHDGNEWQLHDQQNWRRRVYQPAAKAAGVKGDLRVYRLRGSFVSLLLWEGRSLAYVADQAGHSVATLANHYAGVLEELEHEPRTPAAEAIKAARAELKCAQNVRSSPNGPKRESPKSPATTAMGDAGLEPATSALSRRRSPS